MITQGLKVNFKQYKAAAMSQDGRYALYGANYVPNGLKMSTDYGASWAMAGVSGVSFACAMSKSGQYMFGSANSRLYRSDNYGSSWSEIQPAGIATGYWECITCGTTGQYVIVGNGNKIPYRLYISTDYGVTWGEIQPYGNVDIKWNSAAISSDGQHIYVGQYTSSPYSKKSSDGGATWSDFSTDAVNELACSENGEYLIYGANGPAKIYSDYGATLLNSSPSDGGQAKGVACSLDGSRIAVASGTGRIWFSRNYGSSWEEVRPNGDASFVWKSIALSGDGLRMLAGVDDATLRPFYLAYDWNPGMLLNFMD